METPSDDRQQLIKLAAKLTLIEGPQPSAVEGVTLVRHNRNIIKAPVFYEPCAVFVLQGRKRALLGTDGIVFDPQNYLVMASPLPFLCDTEGTNERPMLAVYVPLRRRVILELLGSLDRTIENARRDVPRPFESVPFGSVLAAALCRLLTVCGTPDDAQILGPQIVREIAYRVLTGPQGQCLQETLELDGRNAQISSAIRHIHDHYAESLSIENMARGVGMSPATFHQRFKAVTATSPTQYVKSLRLHRARTLLIDEAIGVSEAAQRVGYESVSQFGREYKRLFGQTPAGDAERLRFQPLQKSTRP